MLTKGTSECVTGTARDLPLPDVEMTELPLLLPAGQAAALGRTARRRGLTTGQMLRQLVRDFFRRPEAPRAEAWD
jgi:hypothetical protein